MTRAYQRDEPREGQLMGQDRTSVPSRAISDFNPMYDPAVRCKKISTIGRSGLASMYPAFAWSAVLQAIIVISARAIWLADRPRLGHLGHQGSHAPGRPILHRRLILSQTTAG